MATASDKGEVFAVDILRMFATHNGVDVDDVHRDRFAAQLLEGAQAALAGYQLAVRPHGDRLDQADVRNGGREPRDIAEILAVALADVDVGNPEPTHWTPPQRSCPCRTSLGRRSGSR